MTNLDLNQNNKNDISAKLYKAFKEVMADVPEADVLFKRFMGSTSARNQIQGNKRRARTPWEEDEIKMLIVGVLRFGIGNWAVIHAQMGFRDKRTFTDLKDKWRNLIDLRFNSRTPIALKNVANFLYGKIGKCSRGQYQMPFNGFTNINDWQTTFQELLYRSNNIQISKIPLPQLQEQSQQTQLQDDLMEIQHDHLWHDDDFSFGGTF